MSKSMVLALAITESAAKSFREYGTSTIDRAAWNETLDSTQFQDLVFSNLKPARSLFSIKTSAPTLQDFRDFKNEYVANLPEYTRWGSVRAFFALLEAEKCLDGRVPEDFLSETAFDFVYEDCQEFLGE